MAFISLPSISNLIIIFLFLLFDKILSIVSILIISEFIKLLSLSFLIEAPAFEKLPE